MTDPIDTSFTVLEPGTAVDVQVFGDPSRHFVIQDPAIGRAFHAVIRQEAPLRSIPVGGGPGRTDASFYVLDLRRDKGLQRDIARVLHDAFVDTTAGALKSSVELDGFLGSTATPKLDAVEQIIELRRFIANASRALPRRKRELLFHLSSREAAP